MRTVTRKTQPHFVLQVDMRTQRGRAKLNELPLSPVLSQQRSGWVEMIEEVERRIAGVERELEKAAAGDERVCRLRTHSQALDC